MYSIRNGLGVVAAMAAGAGLLAGCQRLVPQPAQSPLNETPLIVDEAMQKRDDWSRSSAYYANGATIAGGTDYLWQPHETVPAEYRRFTDAPVAVVNFASMPVGGVVNSSAKKQVYRGESVPPTFHGNPPVPGQPPARSAAPVEPAEPTPVPAPVEPAPATPAEPVEPAPPVVEPVPQVQPPSDPESLQPVAPVTPEPAPPPGAPEPPSSDEPLVPPPPPPAPPATAPQ